MPIPIKYDVHHYRGDSFSMLLRLWDDPGKTQATVLTGSTVTAQARINPDATDVLAAFAVVVTGNQITLQLTPTQTKTLPTTGAYDVQVDWAGDGTRVQTVIAGAFKTDPDVTRSGS